MNPHERPSLAELAGRKKTGDPCPEDGCPGALQIRNSFLRGNVQYAYLACSICGHRPDDNKVIRAAHEVRRRNRIA